MPHGSPEQLSPGKNLGQFGGIPSRHRVSVQSIRVADQISRKSFACVPVVLLGFLEWLRFLRASSRARASRAESS